MIVGIGVDLVNIGRIQRAIEKNKHFKDRVFTKEEQAYCQSGANPWEKYAARYAAKEAFLKVCGQGIFSCPLTDIEVVKDEAGQPSYRLIGKAYQLMEEKNLGRIHLSLSHEKDMAMAFALGEKR